MPWSYAFSIYFRPISPISASDYLLGPLNIHTASITSSTGHI